MLVSAIMPTADRREYVPQAIASFMSQTWPEKELVVIDDGDDDVRDLCKSSPDVTYIQVGKLSLGEKRNVGCEWARGEVIVHFDDDDWSVPERVAKQVEFLKSSGASVTGFYSAFFFDVEMCAAYAFKHPAKERFCLGTSLCYRREWWKEHQFAAKNIGEDKDFRNVALKERGRFVASGDRLIVARIHQGNTSAKNTQTSEFRSIAVSQIPSGFFAMQRSLHP